MDKARTQDKDTTIKDKPQPFDVTDDDMDVAAVEDEMAQASGNIELDEEKLISPRPDSDKEH